jgi:hypothetical protein
MVKIRYEFTEISNLEEALHDTLLEFNGDLADCAITVAANADITFKPCQVSSPAQEALQDGHAAVEVNLQEFLSLLCRMVQIIDGHVTISGPRPLARKIFDLRVVDSSFALVETPNENMRNAFASRLKGARAPYGE